MLLINLQKFTMFRLIRYSIAESGIRCIGSVKNAQRTSISNAVGIKEVYSNKPTNVVDTEQHDSDVLISLKKGGTLKRSIKEVQQLYVNFIRGIKYFMSDANNFVQVRRILHESGMNFSKLIRREIELYHEMPRDVKKVAPVLVLFTVPIAGYFVFPLIFLFPKQLLTTHFWSPAQKAKFNKVILKQRLIHSRALFLLLQRNSFLTSHKLYKPWDDLLEMLRRGCQPSFGKILACKELFRNEPYHIKHLSQTHMLYLLNTLGLQRSFSPRATLTKGALVLREMDKAIMREGGVHNLPEGALRKACFIRGLNSETLGVEEMVRWLRNWMQLSEQTDTENYSLLLHSPLLLGYNSPSNKMLLRQEKQ